MSVRRALLIGVPENKRDPNLDLPVVRNDISLLQDSLEGCGYSVKTCGIATPSEVSSNLIEGAIHDACVEAPQDSTLIIYFSGHGIHFNGKDLLIPWDGHYKDPSRIERELINTDISSFVDRSHARLVVFFIDACRVGLQWEFKAHTLREWGCGEINNADRRRLIHVYSCGPGEFSQYTSGEHGFSLFSKALATVLAPTHSAETVGEVVRAAQEELDELIRECGKSKQHIRLAGEQALGSEFLSLNISDKKIVEADHSTANIRWQNSVTESRLWQFASTPEHASAQSLIESSKQIVTACEREWVTAASSIDWDPWRDYNYPLRVISCLEMLVSSLSQLNLSPAEASILVTVPFVREAIYSCSVIDMSKARPLDISTQSNNLALSSRRRLEMTHAAFPQLIRKANRVQGEAAAAIALWLMHRSITRDPDTWQVKPDGHISTQLFGTLNTYQEKAEGLNITQPQLIEFAQCINCDPSRIERADRTYFLRERLLVGEGKHEQHIREQLLGYLLCIAGWMALDIRAMSDLLPDHLGIADPVDPVQLFRALESATWRAIGNGRSVYVQCQHPAIDYSIRELVTRANEVLITIHRRASEKGSYLESLTGLPSRLGTELISPAILNGKAVYETPHLNFHLAHDEVRELLMGEQLYDEPELAIRELYQNALDACRYRDARLQYLARTGKLHQNYHWQGNIEFEQGKDKRRGRRYIECRDNGIGMSHREIESCFAKAGKRFCDLPEFIEEQSEWLRCNPPIRIFPNSQFGVGVFSYFMLADEIEIETCRMDRKGRPGTRLLITVPGSGSLFRIQELGPGSDAGTRVRLYLRDSEKIKDVSCVDVLTSLLWVAEFRTRAKHGRRKAIWTPGVLRHSLNSNSTFVKDPDLPIWWSTEPGELLADGIRLFINVPRGDVTGDLAKLLSLGLIVNLTGEYKPSLTVDRRKARSWDSTWVLEGARQSIRCIYDWEDLSYMWLWSLLSVFPEYEGLINQELTVRDRVIPVQGTGHSATEPLTFSRYSFDDKKRNLFCGQECPGLKIYIGDAKPLAFKDIGLSKVRVSEIGVLLQDARLWRLVWEAWNWDLIENKEDEFPTRYRYEEKLEFTYPNSRLSEDKANIGKLEFILRFSKWNKKLNDLGAIRLEVWQRAGLLLPDWLTTVMEEFKADGLTEHYAIGFIPKSGLSWKRLRYKVAIRILKFKKNSGDELLKILAAIVLLAVLYFVVIGAIALTKYVLR